LSVGIAPVVAVQHPQRLSGPDVRRDLLVAHVPEPHQGRGHRTDRGPGAGRVARVDQPMAGVQDALAAAHTPPPIDSFGRTGRLAVRFAVELQH
jgi:hypothetical protein